MQSCSTHQTLYHEQFNHPLQHEAPVASMNGLLLTLSSAALNTSTMHDNLASSCQLRRTPARCSALISRASNAKEPRPHLVPTNDPSYLSEAPCSQGSPGLGLRVHSKAVCQRVSMQGYHRLELQYLDYRQAAGSARPALRRGLQTRAQVSSAL
jgi:hypothetical protein